MVAALAVLATRDAPGERIRALFERAAALAEDRAPQEETPPPGTETTPSAPAARARTPPADVKPLYHRLPFLQNEEHVTVKFGMFEGTGSDNELFDEAYYGELEIGHRLDDFSSAQFRVGYLDSSERDNGEKTTVSAVPLLVGLSLDYPTEYVELQAGAGLGIVVCDLRRTRGTTRITKSKTLWGGDFWVSVNFNLHANAFITLEGRYLWTSHTRFDDESVDLDGLGFLAGVGFRF